MGKSNAMGLFCLPKVTRCVLVSLLSSLFEPKLGRRAVGGGQRKMGSPLEAGSDGERQAMATGRMCGF